MDEKQTIVGEIGEEQMKGMADMLSNSQNECKSTSVSKEMLLWLSSTFAESQYELPEDFKGLIQDNKRILIVGQADTEKTMLIKELIRCNPSKTFVVLEKTNELDLNFSNIVNLSFESLSDEIININQIEKMDQPYIIFNEITNQDDAKTLIEMAYKGHPVIGVISGDSAEKGLSRLTALKLDPTDYFEKELEAVKSSFDCVIFLNKSNNK